MLKFKTINTTNIEDLIQMFVDEKLDDWNDVCDKLNEYDFYPDDGSSNITWSKEDLLTYFDEYHITFAKNLDELGLKEITVLY